MEYDDHSNSEAQREAGGIYAHDLVAITRSTGNAETAVQRIAGMIAPQAPCPFLIGVLTDLMLTAARL